MRITLIWSFWIEIYPFLQGKFQLSDHETLSIVSQNAIPSKQHLSRHSIIAFAEHDVLILANVLRSERALQVSI